MRSRPRLSSGATTPPPAHVRLRPASELPPRAKGVVGLFLVVDLVFTVWVAIRLWSDDAHGLAVVLIVMAILGAIVIGVAVLTLVRVAFSLHALPYLLGRGVRRLLTGR